MKLLVLFMIIFSFSEQVFAKGMGDRPLRTLKIGSELYLSVGSQLLLDGFYQDGIQVIPKISMNDDKPFCKVNFLSMLPPHDQREEPLTLIKSEGSLYDQGQNDSWAKFTTFMRFSTTNQMYDLEINCFSQPLGLFQEMTIDELATVFGNNIRFGKVDIDDQGIEKRDPLYPEYDVLTPSLLRESILVEIKEDVTLLKSTDPLAWPEIHIYDGKASEVNDFTKPYCSLFVIDETGTAPSSVTIPANTKMRFVGDISGGYVREDGIELGFHTMGDLKGFNYPLRLLCNSGDPAKPFRYANMRKTTSPVIDWAYTF